MNEKILAHTILARVARDKLKVFLMGIGLVISVLATILAQTVADGFRREVAQFMERAYPADNVMVVGMNGAVIHVGDAQAVASSLSEITAWDPFVMGGKRTLKLGGKSVQVQISGYSEAEPDVRHRVVAAGQFFNADEVRDRAQVAVIGLSTAKVLFGERSAVGQELFIDNMPFRVRGVLAPFGVDVHGNDQDNAVFIPYTTLLDRMLKLDRLNALSLRVTDRRETGEVAQQVLSILKERNQIGPGDRKTYVSVTPVAMQRAIDRASRTVSILIPAVMGLAFLVSAIVVMIVMTSSICARTAEIGLRRAVGARRGDLQLQITLETVAVAIAASIVGIALAEIAMWIMTPYFLARFGLGGLAPGAQTIVIGVAAAVLSALAGALLPARRAARLNPVQALR